MTEQERMQEAFLSPDADDLFISVAAFSEASELAEIDVAQGHTAGRRALEAAIVNATRRRASEGTRTALIRGAAGSGKTHLVAATLRKAAADHSQSVLPAVLQFTAPVTIGGYERWLIDTVFRELSARHFPDGEGRSPLRRLADSLLDRVSDEDRTEFLDYVDDLDEDGEIPIAIDLGARIRHQARAFLQHSPPPTGFLGVLLLAGYGDESAVEYLRSGRVDERVQLLGVKAPETGPERLDVLRLLGLTAELAGCTLVFVFDQVEAVVDFGVEGLFKHTLVQGLRLAHEVPSLAMGFVALKSAYDRIADRDLSQSERDRLEREPPSGVALEQLSPEILRKVLARRLEVLRARRGVSSEENSLAPLPQAVIDQALEADSVRRALLSVSAFRAEVLEQGWKVAPPPPPPPPPYDWDKAWADFHDSGPTVDLKMLTPTKVDLLGWWATCAGQELSRPYSVQATAGKFEPPRTHVIDIGVKHEDVTVELRQLAFCDAKNQHGKLRNQVEAFLDWSSGVPAVHRAKGFARGKTAQVAPALADLRANHGLIVDIAPSEWNSLARARQFYELHEKKEDLLRWRREAQWLRQLVKPLGVLIAPPSKSGARPDDNYSPEGSGGSARAGGEEARASGSKGSTGAVASVFPVFVGTPVGEGESDERVCWDPYRAAPNQLNNFSFLITGDPGAGKTQTIRVLIDAACRADLPTLIFDFKADYDEEGFAKPLGLEVVDVRRRGLPFNPLKPPPGGASGAQPAEHAYEIAGLLKRTMGLGDVQAGLVRDAINGTYQARGIDPRDWVDPEAEDWPTFDAVVERLREEAKAANIVTRVAPLVELGLFPAGYDGPSFSDLMTRKVVLSLSELPTDELKSLLAEMIIIQAHGHALRGEQPRRLARMMVFDEAHRVATSKRLEALGREGRAFGISVVIGTQFPGDIPDAVAGTMATQLSLMNAQADHRRAVVRQVYSTTSSSDAKQLGTALSQLKPLQGLFTNAHHRPTLIDVHPHYLRRM